MTFHCRDLGDSTLGEWSSAAVDYTFQTLDESLIGVALVTSSSQRKVLDKMKRSKRRTADDSGWLISEGRCAALQTFLTLANRWRRHWVNLSLHTALMTRVVRVRALTIPPLVRAHVPLLSM